MAAQRAEPLPPTETGRKLGAIAGAARDVHDAEAALIATLHNCGLISWQERNDRLTSSLTRCDRVISIAADGLYAGGGEPESVPEPTTEDPQ